MNSGRILVNGSSFYCGNSTSNLCQLALKSDIPNVTQYVHPSTKQCSGGDAATLSGHSYSDIVNSSSVAFKTYSVAENSSLDDTMFSFAGDESFVATIPINASSDFSVVNAIIPYGYFSVYSGNGYIHHGLGVTSEVNFPKTSGLSNINITCCGHYKEGDLSRGVRIVLKVSIIGKGK